MITQLPQTPNVGPEVPQSLWNWLVELGKRIRALIDWVNNYTPPAGGDMSKSVYDTDDDGVVDAAASADSVPWSGVIDPPAFASPGDIKISARKTPETGWLKCNGQTIGDSSSGATARANDDTWELFEILWTDWSDAECPIFTSTGEASTRGATAEADFAAHKRISLPDIRDEHVRGWPDDKAGTPNTGAAFGSKLDDAMQGHYHGPLSPQTTISGVNGPSTKFGGATGTTRGDSSTTGGPVTDGVNGTPRTASETRVRAIFLSYFIKY
jgi:hypothetical protein